MTISVLLVEDHQIVREGTRQLLELHQDLQIVGEASDGLEAVSLAGVLQPDVIVMDVRLPKLNGVEATRAITTRHPGIKVLILSAYEDDSYVFPLLDAGASGYLLKTSSSIELASAIRLVFAGQMALSPRISTKIVNRLGGRHSYRNEAMPRGLTEREMDVLKAAAHGKPNKEIALNLGITTQTVQVHLRNIFVKLDVNSRSEAVAHAIKHGWITLEAADE
ncbi:MAG: DNA-binding response regulator [Chloroflexi bacterium HGW-Chloroflexi-4]|jgi:DNA-binding NarL/FixJ family response regulator|nr:MAG: DNA-binding response regulator [Chloroflexi bacterium HGW-Chloroflexi-4]